MLSRRQCKIPISVLLFGQDAVFIPAGTWYNVVNIGRNALKVSSVYAPPNHRRGTVHFMKADAEREIRLRILGKLRTGENCACKLLDDLHITQSPLSHHMKILCDAGIVQGRKDEKWVYYSISPEGADCARKLLGQQLPLEAFGGENGSCRDR